MTRLALLLVLSQCAGCGSQLTGYNLKANIGQTSYEDGRQSIYTGATVDAHFDIRR